MATFVKERPRYLQKILDVTYSVLLVVLPRLHTTLCLGLVTYSEVRVGSGRRELVQIMIGN